MRSEQRKPAGVAQLRAEVNRLKELLKEVSQGHGQVVLSLRAEKDELTKNFEAKISAQEEVFEAKYRALSELVDEKEEIIRRLQRAFTVAIEEMSS